MSQDLVRARRGVSSGPDTHVEQADRTIASVVHEIDEMRAAIERIERLHSETLTCAMGIESFCSECGMPFPCSTIRALGGDR